MTSNEDDDGVFGDIKDGGFFSDVEERFSILTDGTLTYNRPVTQKVRVIYSGDSYVRAA